GKKAGSRNLSYALGDLEWERVRRAYLRVAEAAFAAGARAVTPVFYGSKRSKNLKDLERSLPRELPKVRSLGGSVHPMGTCGIGRTCEGDGRVRGYENLYVADASLFPTSIGVNPQFTVMALGTAVAAGILDSPS
ncbi:MAG: GMC family oxidoreductase, partial [Bdellovibrionota bacterium]